MQNAFRCFGVYLHNVLNKYVLNIFVKLLSISSVQYVNTEFCRQNYIFCGEKVAFLQILVEVPNIFPMFRCWPESFKNHTIITSRFEYLMVSLEGMRVQPVPAGEQPLFLHTRFNLPHHSSPRKGTRGYLVSTQGYPTSTRGYLASTRGYLPHS